MPWPTADGAPLAQMVHCNAIWVAGVSGDRCFTAYFAPSVPGTGALVSAPKADQTLSDGLYASSLVSYAVTVRRNLDRTMFLWRHLEELTR